MILRYSGLSLRDPVNNNPLWSNPVGIRGTTHRHPGFFPGLWVSMLPSVLGWASWVPLFSRFMVRQTLQALNSPASASSTARGIV